MQNVLKGLAHGLAESFVYLFLGPEQLGQPLDPFEIRNGDAAGIGQDVRNQKHSLVGENLVSARSCRTIGSLCNNPGPDAIGVRFGNLVLQGGGEQHVAVQLQQFRVGHLIAIGKVGDAAAVAFVGGQLVHVDTGRAVYASLRVACCNDDGALLFEQHGRNPADIAETLHRDARPLQRHAHMFQAFYDGRDTSATGRFLAPTGAAHGYRFSSNHAAYGVADTHAVGVHDPRHDLGVGVHVGCRNVGFGAQDDHQLTG